MKQRKFADAVLAFGEALKLYPDDQRATAALQQARYTQFMVDGQTALNAKRYADAVKAFEDALKEVPGDQAATAALKQARALNKK
jgi:cytochrome c-type biogenesis protein CcmH/NrfG